MAWGLKYQGIIYNRGLGECLVYIYEDGYVGSSNQITIAFNGLDIEQDTKEYFETIHSRRMTLKIVNDKDNFYELEELFIVSDNQYLVTVESNTLGFYVFRGYMPCETIEQTWLKSGIITLNATCNLNRLDEYYPDILSTIGMYTFMDIIEDCLSNTQLDLPIWVNSSLHAFGAAEGTVTCFDEAWIDSDLYYENSLQRKNCKDILESILKSFSCVIYYHNDRWYIERSKDIGGASNAYKVYTGGSYVETQDITNTDLVLGTDLRLANSSQVIKYIPGVKQIEVSLNQVRRFNYVNWLFDDITAGATLALLELGQGVINYWYTVNEAYVAAVGSRFNGRANACVVVENSYDATVTDGIDETNPSHADIQLRMSLIGIYTRFGLKLNDTGNTSLNISFKFYLPTDFLEDFTYFVSDCVAHPENHIFFARFYIGISGLYFLHYNDAESKYEFREQSDLTVYGGGHDWGLIQVAIPFSEFIDKANYYHEFTKTIELNHDIVGLSGIPGETLWTLGICELGYNNPLYSGPGGSRFLKANYGLRTSIYGDVIVTGSDPLGNNLIIGSITKGFVNVEKVEVDLWDSTGYNVANAMYLDDGSDGKQLTTTWSDTIGVNLSLIQHMIRDHFQLRNKVRREITSDMYCESFIRPFSLINTGLPNPGTVQITAAKTVTGTATQFLRTFEVDDAITVNGVPNFVEFIESDTELHVVNLVSGYDVVSEPHLTYTGGIQNRFYVNGYRYNLGADLYYNMSLKEWVDDDGLI